MVFSSMHPYLDPANWPQQQQPSHQIGSSSGPGSQLLPPPPPPLPPPPSQSHGASGSGSIRPGSMADRARMANIPMPEATLKCPRCDSTNTKFCYFNNYSLSQPRHFCKTCRRYWTQGGALRNVPVGGGCRRNKRSKGSSSKSPPVSSDRQTGSATSNNSVSSNSASATDMVGLSPQLPSSLRFSAPTWHQLTEFGSGEMGLSNYGLSNQMGGVGDLSFHIGTALTGGASGSGSSILSASGLEQWRMSQTQQFPFLTGLEASPDLYQFQSGAAGPVYGGGPSQLRPKVPSGVITQLASVKMEDRHNHRQELNLSRHFLGMNSNSTNHEQYWNTTAGNSNTTANWTELSGFRSSSTTSNNPP